MAKSFKIDTDKFFSVNDEQPDDAPETHEPQRTQRPQIAPETVKTHEKDKKSIYRINLKLKGEFEDYLKDQAWLKRVSVTQYISDLIEKDIENTQATKGTLDT